jgi:hypothetical protein
LIIHSESGSEKQLFYFKTETEFYLLAGLQQTELSSTGS